MKVLVLLLTLATFPAFATSFPCLVTQGDSDGNGTNNINDLNYVKFVLANAYEAAADLTCEGVVNINDVNKEKSAGFLGSDVIWKTVGGNGYNRIDCIPGNGYLCDTWAHLMNWYAGNCGGGGNCSTAQVGQDLGCVPLQWPPHNRVYSENILYPATPAEPSLITDNLEIHFWGNPTSGPYTAYYTMCYMAGHNP